MSAFGLGLSQANAQKRFRRQTNVEGVSALGRVSVPKYSIATLPPDARQALYNLRDDEGAKVLVPGDQVVFYCFNYGSPQAVSFAAGLPRVCLELALGRPGFRPKARALLAAVLRYRGDE